MISEFSIIIPALNEEKYLPRLLSSIEYQSFMGKLQVIVVDGESTDNTIVELGKFKDKINDLTIMKTQKGIGHQRNEGAKIAKYDHLIFIDSDMILTKNCLNQLAKNLKPSGNFIGVVLLLPVEFNLLDYIYMFFSYIFAYIVGFLGKPILSGMFLFTTKDNHLKLGGFNEDITYGEDIDYGLRSCKNGAKYKIFLRSIAFSSTRRKKDKGSLTLGMIWLKWYLYNVIHGPILDKNFSDYKFGEYKGKD